MWQVIGQNRAVSLLQNCLKTGRLAHAYLLVGPPHVGKMTLAVNLAQALNCEAAERPCRECISCHKIAEAKYADVQVIGLSQNGDSSEAKLIGIDQIKQVQHTASLPPFEGNHKVFIIDRAELLSIEAANCLLKTLEEPVDDVTFILLTTNDRLLPETVVSRCQRLELPPLAATETESTLRAEYNIEPERARQLAGLSRGCPGWALAAAADATVLEQYDNNINELLRILDAECEDRFTLATRLAAQFNQNRSSVYDLLNLWIDLWHDLMLVKIGCPELITNIDRLDDFTQLAGGYRLAQIFDFIKSLQSTATQLRQNANPRLALEVLMLDIPRKERGVGGKPGGPVIG